MAESLTYLPQSSELQSIHAITSPDDLQQQQLVNKFNDLSEAPAAPVNQAIQDNGGNFNPFGTDLTHTPAYTEQESRVKAMLYDPINLGGQADQAVANSQKTTDSQEYRDQVAAFAAVSHLTGTPLNDVVDNFGFYQAALEKNYGFDPSDDVGTFRKNLQGLFEKHDARTVAIDNLKSQAIRDAFEDADKGMSVPSLARFQNWQKTHEDALKGLPESDRLNAFNSVYKPIQQALNTPDGQLAKKFVDAVAGKTKPVDGATENASPEFQQQIDPKQFIKGLTPEHQTAVLSIAQQYFKSVYGKSKGGAIDEMYALQKSFTSSAESFNRYDDVHNLLDLEFRRDAAVDPEEKQKLSDQYNDILLAQKVRQFSQATFDAAPVHYGWKGAVSHIANGISGMIPQVAPFIVPAIGTAAYGMNEIANQTLQRMQDNPNMSAREAYERSTVPAAVSTAIGTKGILLLGKVAPTVVGALKHMAGATVFLSTAEGVKTLYAQLENAWNKDINAGRDFAEEYWGILKEMPYMFAELGILGAAGHVLSRGGKVDPEVEKQAAKNAADPMALKEQGFSHEEATRIAELHESERVQAIKDGWNERTKEDIELGKQLQKDNNQKIVDAIQAPDAPKLVNNFDGTFHVITMDSNGKEHTVTFSDKDAAQDAYTMAMQDHMLSKESKQTSEGNDWTDSTTEDAKTVSDTEKTPAEIPEVQPEDTLPDELVSETTKQEQSDAMSQAQQEINDFLKNRASGESAFVDFTPIYEKLSEYGKAIYEKGMTFADWSKRMISDFGDKVKDVLSKIWNAYKSLGNTGAIGGKADDLAAKVNTKKKKSASDQIAEIAQARPVEKLINATAYAEKLGIPSTIPDEYKGMPYLPIMADRLGGGTLRGVPLEGGSIHSLLKHKGDGVVTDAWKSKRMGIQTILTMLEKHGVIQTDKNGKHFALVAPFTMAVDTHKSNNNTSSVLVGDIRDAVKKGIITKENEAKVDELIRKKVPSFVGFTHADIVDQYSKSSFEDRAAIADVLKSKQAQELGVPNIERTIRHTTEPSLLGSEVGSITSLLKVDIDRLATQDENGNWNLRNDLSAEDFGGITNLSYDTVLPSYVVSYFKNPVPFDVALPDGLAQLRTEVERRKAEGIQMAKQALETAKTEEQRQEAQKSLDYFQTKYNIRPDYAWGGRYPNTPEGTVTKAQVLTDKVHAEINSIQSIETHVGQARLFRDALTDNWTVYDKGNGKGLAEFVHAVSRNDAAETLTKYDPKKLNEDRKAGKIIVYQLTDNDVWFAIKDREDGGRELVGVMNNTGIGGMLHPMMTKALQEGATHLDCYSVKTKDKPNGILPTSYGVHGFAVYAEHPFDPNHKDLGDTAAKRKAKVNALKDVWKQQGWDGQEMPTVVYMKYEPASIQFRDPHVESVGTRTVEAARGQASETASGTGSAEVGVDRGRSSESPSDGEARLSRGASRFIEELGSANKAQLRALGVTEEQRDSILAAHGEEVKQAGGVPSKTVQAANIRSRLKSQGGFIDPTILKDIYYYGEDIYKKGVEFVDFAKQMLSDLGNHVAGVLQKLWDTYKGSRFASEAGSINITPIIRGVTPPPPTLREKTAESLKRLKGTMRDLPADSPFKKSLLKWSARSQRSTNDIERAQHDIEKVAPQKETREGITNWIEAGGDKSLLKLRANATTDPKLKAGYEAALKFTPEQEKLAGKIQQTFDVLKKRAEAYGIEMGYRDNYVPHVYKTEPQAPSGSTPKRLDEFFKFSQERTFDTYHEGEQNGYEPETKDIAKLLGLYMNDMNNAINSRRFVEELRGLKASDGRPIVSPRGMGKDTVTDKGTTHLVYPDASDEGTSDYKTLDQPALHDWKFAGKNADGNMVLTLGDLAVHPEVASHLNNALSSSAISKWINARGENPFLNLTKSTIGGAIKLQSYFKGTMLSLSPFHQVQEGIHAIGHRINPFFGLKQIDMRDPAQRDAAEHGLMLAHDRLSQSLFMEGVGDNSSNLITLGLRKIGWGMSTKAADAVDAYQHYLFSQYIPALKFQTYVHMLERNKDRYKAELASGKVSEWQVKNLTARQANAAYGHLNYTDMGHNPTIRHALQLILLAPDFLEARSRFVGQAIKGAMGGKVGAEQLQALGFLAIVQFVGASIFKALLNDDVELDHPFEIRVGNKYYGLRSVPEDMYKLVKQPTAFIGGRISPMFGKFVQEGIFGVNYRGERTSVGDAIADIMASVVPMAFQPLISEWTATGRAHDLSWWEQVLASGGVQIHRYSPITKVYPMAHDWVKANYPEDVQKGSYPVSKYQQLRYALEDGDAEKAQHEIDKLVKGGMKKHDVATGFRSSVNHPFTGSAKHDKEFYKSLNEDDQQRYKAAVERRKEILRRFHGLHGVPAAEPESSTE